MLLWLLLCLPSDPNPVAAAKGTLLDRYLMAPDASYKWSKEKVEGNFLTGTTHHLKLTSQTWQGHRWDHDLLLFVPPGAKPGKTVVLLNTGGNPSGGNRLLGLTIATRLKAPVAVLFQIPNQPLYNRTEDALIAETFVRYLESDGKDVSWPLLFPMAKACVRAMDTLQAYTKEAWKEDAAEKFVLTGASKRGWTTWLASAFDRRIVAFAPLVIDTLNMQDQMKHQFEAFGKPSEQIKDYVERKLVPLPPGDTAKNLWLGVDPFSYRERFQQPKLIVNGANDPYWTADALNLYWDKIPGPKHVLIVPNAGHDLREKNADGTKTIDRALATLTVFSRRAAAGKGMPRLEWKHTGEATDARLTVKAEPAPSKVTLWQVSAPRQDFRKSEWKPTNPQVTGGKAEASVARPESGALAFYALCEFNDDIEPYCLATQVRVLEAGK